MTNFNNVVRSLLHFERDESVALRRVMGEIAERFDCETVTFHVLDRARNLLTLQASRNLPPKIAEITREIPVGKGIAGETAATGKPVTICNLQQDDGGGVAKPRAKETGVGGSLCVPVFRRDELVGTLGIGTRRERTFTDAEVRELTACGRALAEGLAARVR